MNQSGVGVIRSASTLGEIVTGSIITSDADIEKFAKLLIKECADFAEEYAKKFYGTGDYIDKAIRENFGEEL